MSELSAAQVLPDHLQRSGCLCVRQSTLRQAQEHQ